MTIYFSTEHILALFEVAHLVNSSNDSPPMSMERITSLQNPRVKNLVKLREANHRRRQGRFIIEGKRELSRAIAKNCPIEAIFYCEDFFKSEEDMEFLDKIAESNFEFYSLSEEAFQKATYRDGPDGWISIAKMQLDSLDSLSTKNAQIILVLEGIEKPGNFGAILRTANAAGVDAIVLSEPNLEIFNPNSIRASQGAFFDVTIVQTDNVELIDFLEREQIRPILTTPSAQCDLWDVDLKGKIAIVLGAEDKGLSNDWLGHGFTEVKLPMKGVTDSLNVSVTAGIALFETMRQRR